jgi:hypothetical protein
MNVDTERAEKFTQNIAKALAKIDGTADVAYTKMEIRGRRRLAPRPYPLGSHETVAHQTMQILGGAATTHQCRHRRPFGRVREQFKGFPLATRQHHHRALYQSGPRRLR